MRLTLSPGRGQTASDQDINRYKVPFLSPDQKYLLRRYVLQGVYNAASMLAGLVAPVLPSRLTTLDRPVFVIGCSRSGTTLFIDMFETHPELANWSEAAQLFDRRYLDPETDHARTEADATPFECRRLGATMALYAFFAGKRRFVNKHPENSLRIRLLKAAFPDALFIHLIRDGHAVLHSNLAQTRRGGFRQKFPLGCFPKPVAWRSRLGLPLVDQFAHQWVDIVRHVRADAEAVLGPENYLEVRFEAFCRAPAATLRRIDAFCGLDPEARPAGALPESFDPRNDQWRTAIRPADIDRIAPILSPLLHELGYREQGWRPESQPSRIAPKPVE